MVLTLSTAVTSDTFLYLCVILSKSDASVFVTVRQSNLHHQNYHYYTGKSFDHLTIPEYPAIMFEESLEEVLNASPRPNLTAEVFNVGTSEVINYFYSQPSYSIIRSADYKSDHLYTLQQNIYLGCFRAVCVCVSSVYLTLLRPLAL